MPNLTTIELPFEFAPVMLRQTVQLGGKFSQFMLLDVRSPDVTDKSLVTSDYAMLVDLSSDDVPGSDNELREIAKAFLGDSKATIAIIYDGDDGYSPA